MCYRQVFPTGGLFPVFVPPRWPPGPAATQAPITHRDSVFDTMLLASYYYCLWASSALIINPYLISKYFLVAHLTGEWWAGILLPLGSTC